MRLTHFIWLGGFVLLVILGDRLAGFALEKLVRNSQFRYSRLYTERAEADLLLVGNSRGLAFYQPYIKELTGLNGFNISYNGLPIDLAAALVEDYYDRYPAPGLVIIDISLCDRFDDQLVMNFSPYLPYSARIDTLIKKVDPAIRGGLGVSHLFRYNSELFQRALYHQGEPDQDWVVDRQLSQSQSRSIAEDYTFSIKYPVEAIRLLGELVQFCRTHGSRVELVLGPYFPPFLEKIVNLGDFIGAVELATGLPVRDFSGMISDEQLFADFQHLNREGSMVFVDSLVSAGVLASPMGTISQERY